MTYLAIEDLIKEGQIETLRIGINILENALKHVDSDTPEAYWILTDALTDLMYLKREMS